MNDDWISNLIATKNDHLLKSPICEICKREASVGITRYGPIKAACRKCLDAELKGFSDYCKEQEEIEKEWRY